MNAADASQFCTFVVGDYFLGLPVFEVQEVLMSQEMASVPLAPKSVRGLINLRGQIVMVVDLRRRFGLPDLPPGGETMNVVLRAEGGTVSFLVDEVGEVVHVSADRFERPPETLHGVVRDLIRGVYKLDDRLLLELDAERALDCDRQETAEST